ncbi:hypothetical protein KAF25_005869 [Fusarium avenaceum]|uniref:Nucleoside phosphorylase domain-containing protein n=1 Tax=Fusarium avenaceum TaxID=40199 RepID=A0A9P7GXN0_9HYPO|nr:hypothetical protein KAF25_005869 [Fusarium avenaceum]
MRSNSTSSTGRYIVRSLRLAYKATQQIAKSLWLDEQDEDLKAFYAKLIVYCTIIESRILSVGESVLALSDDNLHTLLPPLMGISTVSLEGLDNISIDVWPRDLAGIHDKIRSIKDNASKIEIIRTHLDLGTTPEERKKIEKSLDQCEGELRVRYPEDSSQWAAEDLAPQLNISEPTYAVWGAAQSMFKAMVACMNCTCTPAHDLDARLSLGTYRTPKLDLDVEMDEVDFNMFLSSQQDWQEVIVRAAKEIQVRVAFDESHNPSPEVKCVPAVKTMRVKNLCEQIAKIKSRALYRLVFKVTRSQLFKLQSERSGSSVYKSQNAISLDEFLRNKSDSFTEKTKRVLAVILSSAVFHLHNTPWLESAWNSSNIWFFRSSSSTIPLKPFLHRLIPTIENQYPNDCDSGLEKVTDPDDIDPDDIDPDDVLSHDCPALVILAIMLLEIYFVAPFDILAQRFNVILESGLQSTAFTRYVDVNGVFQACQKEIPENSQFYLAVENCLDPKVWQDEEGNKLDDPTLRTRIYSQVVLPLETELSQAYSDIRIEDLDRFAQDFNFGSWGQSTHVWDQQNSTDTSQSHDHATVAPTALCQESYGLPLHLHNTGDEFRDGRPKQGSPANKRRYSHSPSGTEAESLVSDLPTLPDALVYHHSSYTVGILCALPLELLAVRALLDTKHQSSKYTRGDSNTYALGTMSDHMVVAACLPSGEYGTNAAADSASNMKRTFPNIEFCLLVGIGGGAPTYESDIRLGDVVVSLPTTKYPGVIQYDRGKEIEGNTFELTGSLHPPPRCLMTAISSLRSNPDLPSNALQSSLEEVTRRVPEPLASKYQHPGQEQDWLQKAVCAACQRQGECPNRDSHLYKRAHRSTSQPEIHYGLIASGNRVLKDASVRDRWAQEYGILCFEMEAAGVMNTFPCLVIRGICDYADSYKDKRWQHYAAATAAAYAKLLLEHTAANNSNWRRNSMDEVEGIQYQNIQERSSKRQKY